MITINVSDRQSGVATIRKELLDVWSKYTIIRDTLAGEKDVKAQNKTYLPEPLEAESNATLKASRYTSYKERAVYYNMISPTKEALVGQLFLRPMRSELPSQIAYMEDDANGENLGLEQLVRLAANYLLPYGRAGLLADFPRTNGAVTAADVEAGVRPVIKLYPPWAITNWKIEKRNNVHKLVLLVLEEDIEETTDAEGGFEIKAVKKFRVYRLRENGTVAFEYWDSEKNEREFTNVIKDADGNPFTEIPFEFIGSQNNDVEIDEPPLYSMAILNIAHYRNSADYEESVYLVGQPTPVYTGLTHEWVEEHFSKGVPFGARASVPLPEGADAKLLQAQPNTLAYEAMQQKERQMIAIGAKIIGPRSTVERKEKEIEIESAGQTSVLNTIRQNLQDAFKNAILKAASFLTTAEATVDIELNDNFDLTSMTAEEIRWLIELFKARVVPYSAVHENLRRSGIVKGSEDEATEAILADQEFIDKVTPKPEPAGSPPPKPPTES